MGNRFLSEQGIFTDTSSHASLNLLGYETGTSPSLRRSVCNRENKVSSQVTAVCREVIIEKTVLSLLMKRMQSLLFKNL